MSDAATEATADPQPQKAFGRTYWLLNSIEALERLAYFGIRAVVPLMQQPHLLFAMVAHHPWPHDIGFLQALLESSPQAVAAARDKAGKDLSPQEIAESLTVIQAALSAIDWVQHADAAAKIIGKNVFEARALAAADMNQSQLRTTEMLWEDYKPHLHVWIPFGIIGILATIALGIFGQMAKRWKDMNV
ncbi:MAG: hypothetical protein A2289_09265 [Deltaproteobacteria bacterium RIFOXYA12_FULL_58_15]|nr:MAG: hypothetical protein A2289_09265 [Deltaproteobacteria bacterium RIFOXYA12_FULL_58_15]OGR12225.1 MAG: hypothetical protein A2341_21055 [Deltaproteobacteria bacterium RIFOXYB12_FULL_58_9]